MTGIAFARVSRPMAKVLFSQPLIIGKYNGLPSVIFRSANQRRNQIVEAQISFYVMLDIMDVDEAITRRVYELPLIRSKTPNFSLTGWYFRGCYAN